MAFSRRTAMTRNSPKNTSRENVVSNSTEEEKIVYTYDVEILLKRTDPGIPQRQNISPESFKGSYCIASEEVMHIDF